MTNNLLPQCAGSETPSADHLAQPGLSQNATRFQTRPDRHAGVNGNWQPRMDAESRSFFEFRLAPRDVVLYRRSTRIRCRVWVRTTFTKRVCGLRTLCSAPGGDQPTRRPELGVITCEPPRRGSCARPPMAPLSIPAPFARRSLLFLVPDTGDANGSS